jgi:hypothetical protein
MLVMVGSLVNASPTVARRDNEKAVEAVCFCQDGMTIRSGARKTRPAYPAFPVRCRSNMRREGEGRAQGSCLLVGPAC